MIYKVTEEPKCEPLSLVSMKHHLRLEHSDDDTVISELITRARKYFETQHDMALIEQVVQITLDAWPSDGDRPTWAGRGSLLLPVRPLIKLIWVSVYDENDITFGWAAGRYRTSGGLEPRLIRRDGYDWPPTERDKAGINITCKVGFGSDAGDVPLLISHGLKELVTHLYFNRSDALEKASVESGAATLWAPYKRVKLL